MSNELVTQLRSMLILHAKSHDQILESKISFLLTKLQDSNKTIYTELKQIFHSQIIAHSKELSFLRQRPSASSKTKTSNDITKTLRHALEIADQEVGRSVDLNISLKTSTDIAKKTGMEYSTMNEDLGKSGVILRKLANKDSQDRMWLASGIGIFLLTVIYIVYKRFWIPFL
jgi:hypothetical protein